MKKKTKIIVSLVIFFSLINIIIYQILEINKQQRIQVALDTHLEKLEINYKTLIYHWKVTADAAYKSTIGMNTVVEIFSKAQATNSKAKKAILRKQLYNKLKNKFSALKTKGVVYFSFVFADNSVFLRMYKPEQFGDNVSNIRYSIKHANETKKAIHGYDQGKISPAFRNSYPIFDHNNQHIGALEISFSSESLKEYFTNISKMHTHFLIHKKTLSVLAWQKEDFTSQHTTSSEHPDFLVNTRSIEYNNQTFAKNIKRLQPINRQIIKQMGENKKFSLYIIDNNMTVVISFYPIRNIKDKKILAWIVSYDKDDFIDATLKINIFIQIIIFFILLILFYFLFKIINQKEILNTQVNEKTKILALTNRELEESKCKLQLINENLKKMVKEEVEKNQKKEEMMIAQSRHAAMGEMISMIAHQWRQPITVISMVANNLLADVELDDVSPENVQNSAVKVLKQSHHLSQTIDDFKNFFRPDKKTELTLVNDVLEENFSIIGKSLENHNISINKDYNSQTAIELHSRELLQVFINILKNAKEALLENNIENPTIWVSTNEDDKTIYIAICNNGVGIKAEILAKIYDPYFSTKDEKVGTGLGLYMTKTIIEKHLHGIINTVNREEGGVCFNISLTKKRGTVNEQVTDA